MPKRSTTPSREILEAALQGLESQREKLDEQIAEVRRMVSGRGAAKTSRLPAKKHAGNPGRPARKRRALSQEARNRIAAAQKKRWAAFRKTQS